MFRLAVILILFILPSWLRSQEVTHDHSIHHAFLENKGQWNDDVLFMNKFEGGNLWVEQGRVLFHLMDYSEYNENHFAQGKKDIDSLTFRQKVVNLHFDGANEVTEIEKEGETDHFFNFFLGNDPEKWQSDVRGFESFVLKNTYDNIDLRFIEQEKEIKYEFIVAPNANPDQIKLRYTNQDEIEVDKDGNLVLTTFLGKIIEQKPYAYQIANGKIVEIPCEFKLDSNRVTFEIGDYNKRVALIIDPTLIFATYCGSISDNFGMTATYGYDGTAYNAGMVYGNAYPTPDPNAYDINSNMTVVNVGNSVTTDAFISKYSPDGTSMIWSTYFGGGDNTQGTDVPQSLICDRDNNIYVYGVTSAIDFPIVNGFQTNHAGGTPFSIVFNGTNFGNVGTDIFVAKFSANGQSLLGSTYVGGSQNDGLNFLVSSTNYSSVAAYDSLTTNYGDQFRGEIMLDSINNIVVASCTRSLNFPTVNPFQPSLGGHQDGVVFKLESDFSGLQWSSFYGGSENDAAYSVKIDSSANIVFAGGTVSNDLPSTAGGYQSTYSGGTADGFIGKLTPNGQTLVQSTYIGESSYDQVFFVEIDRLDNIFVVGQSNGGNFPVLNATYSNPNSGQFIAKLSPDLTTLIGSTVFGSGSSVFDISPSAFLVDICGNMYVSGWGANILQNNPVSGMPVTSDAYLPTAPNGFDFYLIVIEREFNSLLYGTYMGGPLSDEHVDGGTSRFDKNGVVYQGVCAGCFGNSDFPTTPGAWSDQNLTTDACNALVFKFDFNLIPNAEISVESTKGCAPFEVTFNNFSSDSDSYLWDFGNGNVDSTTFEPVITYTTPGTYEVSLLVTDSICLITDTAFITIEVSPALQIDNISDIDLCEPDTILLQANSFGTADEFIWSSNNNFTDTLNASLTDSVVQVNNPTDGYYYIMLSNEGCSIIDSVEVTFTSSALVLSGDSTMCLGDELTITANSQTTGVTFSDYDWSPDNSIISGDNTNSVVVSPEATGYIYVSAQASNGCLVEDSVQVLVSDINENTVTASASENNVVAGSTVTLTAQPAGYSYTWLPAGNLTDPNAQETNAYMEETTDFIVLVSDGICDKAAQVTVNVFEFVCDEPFVYVPNAFTPNGDGDNDVLYVRSSIVSEVTFRVYNRWGELMFETNDMNIGWDGTYKGKFMDPDVYDYYLEGYCIDNQEFLIKGNVTLIR